ncbi:YeeE/YedE family protein [Flavobacterium sp. HXWNR69]|uniref:YeeE/YedE family protein n=1 Tax=Flavobacterium fragile TaxID=2949085 RepID=A0ABT0TGD8_9FLAO|nr:DUF6691 family protein [Flavobacterium sp. HXWNR69]MCL9770045.1 YeeE/YedE family protein [Flavobacterium sp. HXWNR69]
MKLVRFFLVGVFFGIALTKGEAVSWYRIYEMFHFQSFHMYGIMGVAFFTGFVGLQLIKKYKVKDYNGLPINIIEKERGFWRYIIGGSLFGLGWALVGSCPGPIFILLGTGTYAIALVLIGALLGTYIYGLVKDKLPH